MNRVRRDRPEPVVPQVKTKKGKHVIICPNCGAVSSQRVEPDTFCRNWNFYCDACKQESILKYDAKRPDHDPDGGSIYEEWGTEQRPLRREDRAVWV